MNIWIKCNGYCIFFDIEEKCVEKMIRDSFCLVGFVGMYIPARICERGLLSVEVCAFTVKDLMYGAQQTNTRYGYHINIYTLPEDEHSYHSPTFYFLRTEGWRETLSATPPEYCLFREFKRPCEAYNCLARPVEAEAVG